MRILRIILTRTEFGLIINDCQRIFRNSGTICLGRKDSFELSILIRKRLIVTQMQRIYTAKRIADKKEKCVRRVTTENRLILTIIDILTQSCFPLEINSRLTICLVGNEGSCRFGGSLLSQITLIRKTIIEKLIAIPHTNVLVNRIMVNTRHANHRANGIIIIGYVTQQVLFMQHCMHFEVHERDTILRWQIRFIR